MNHMDRKPRGAWRSVLLMAWIAAVGALVVAVASSDEDADSWLNHFEKATEAVENQRLDEAEKHLRQALTLTADKDDLQQIYRALGRIYEAQALRLLSAAEEAYAVAEDTEAQQRVAEILGRRDEAQKIEEHNRKIEEMRREAEELEKQLKALEEGGG